MSERYGNFANGLSFDEMNERVAQLNTRIEQVDDDIEALKDSYAAGVVSQEDYERLREVLGQQLSIETYKRDAYMSSLD